MRCAPHRDWLKPTGLHRARDVAGIGRRTANNAALTRTAAPFASATTGCPLEGLQGCWRASGNLE
jgi:hypothetical protein